MNQRPSTDTLTIVVLGVGNDFASDDGVGRYVARQLTALHLPGVTIQEQPGEAAELIEAWQGADVVFLVDAVHSGAKPGTVHRFEADAGPLPAEAFGDASTHAFGVAVAVELSRVLRTLPDRVAVIGIEGKSFEPGQGLSTETKKAADWVVHCLANEIRRVANSEPDDALAAQRIPQHNILDGRSSS